MFLIGVLLFLEMFNLPNHSSLHGGFLFPVVTSISGLYSKSCDYQEYVDAHLMSTFSIPPNFKYFLDLLFCCVVWCSITSIWSFQFRLVICRSWFLTFTSISDSMEEIPRVPLTQYRQLDRCMTESSNSTAMSMQSVLMFIFTIFIPSLPDFIPLRRQDTYSAGRRGSPILLTLWNIVRYFPVYFSQFKPASSLKQYACLIFLGTLNLLSIVN